MLVTELLRANLYEFSRYNRESGDEPYFTLPRIQSIARQVRGPRSFFSRMLACKKGTRHQCSRAGLASSSRKEEQQPTVPLCCPRPPPHTHGGMQVLTSLFFMHSLGLVHADLKPENILVKSYSRCQVKVIDLGSSCYVTDHLSSYVQVRTFNTFGW